MNDSYPICAASREFVRRCLGEYFAHLPAALRSGWDMPLVSRPYGRCAHTVPSDMADGPTDLEGRVAWRWLQVEPHPGWVFDTRVLPPAFWAYQHFNHVCRFLLRDDRSSYLLPATPSHEPGFAYSKLDWNWRTDRQSEGRRELTGFWPLGQSEDGKEVLCADMHSRDSDGDAPVVAFDREAVFRLRPQLVLSTSRRQLLAPLARPLFGSFREMLGHYCLSGGRAWTGREQRPQSRALLTAPPPFDWEPWLDPEPAPDRFAPDQTRQEPEPRAVEEHLNRIASKIRAARLLDPACLAAGSDWHEYETNPTLSLAERQTFEANKGVRLPEAYAQFLMRIGNGGVGPGAGLCRLEESMFGFCEGDGPLSTPFPHRALWELPTVDAERDGERPEGSDEESGGASPGPTQGSLILSRWPMRGGPAYALLVVSGPERGHVWVDRRFADDDDWDDQMLFAEGTPRGVVPVVRRGPYSFLAWYESHLDKMLDQAEVLYQSLRKTER